MKTDNYAKNGNHDFDTLRLPECLRESGAPPQCDHDPAHQEPPAPERLAAVLNAAGDETRLRIIHMLWDGAWTTKDLSGALGLSASTVSTHLKQLRLAGMIRGTKEKKFVYYHFDRSCLPVLYDDFVAYMQKP